MAFPGEWESGALGSITFSKTQLQLPPNSMSEMKTGLMLLDRITDTLNIKIQSRHVVATVSRLIA